MSKSPPLPKHVPVLIVGAGPAGLSAALTLALNGVPPVVIERHPSTSSHPKALGLMQRTMELFRSWGVENALRTRGLPEAWSDVILWKNTLMGQILATIDNRAGADSPERRFSPTLAYRCSQTETETVLAQRVQNFAGAEVIFGTELAALNRNDDGVTVTVRDVATDKATQMRCDYLIAADGAASHVREALAIDVEGPGDMGQFVNIYHEADYGSVLGEQRAMIYNTMGREWGGSFLPVDGRFRWLFHTELGPGETREDYTEAHATHRIRQCLGGPDVNVKVLSIDFWTMAAQVSKRWRKGRILLTGDAAHRTTPIGGLGMNTAIASAHNLGWKLAGVIKGWAGETLLDSYEAERRPVVEANVIASQEGGKGMLKLIAAAERGDYELLAKCLRQQSGSKSRIGQDLGYTYVSDAILPDGTDAPSMPAPLSEYAPTARPGSRAPHLWVWHRGLRLSTLDLFSSGFTVLTGPQGQAWKAAATALEEKTDWPLKAYIVGADGDLVEHTGDWCETYGVTSDGAVLIRPDGFVAWRCPSQEKNPAATLEAAFRQATGL